MTTQELTVSFAVTLVVLAVGYMFLGSQLERHEERRIGVLLWVGAAGLLGMLLTGCCDAADLADDAPAVPCKIGLLNAALRTELTVPNVEPFCESVGDGEACAAICNVHGRGLICDAEGCEEHERP